MHHAIIGFRKDGEYYPFRCSSNGQPENIGKDFFNFIKVNGVALKSKIKRFSSYLDDEDAYEEELFQWQGEEYIQYLSDFLTRRVGTLMYGDVHADEDTTWEPDGEEVFCYDLDDGKFYVLDQDGMQLEFNFETTEEEFVARCKKFFEDSYVRYQQVDEAVYS